jgi:hypothetical protein
MYFEDIYYKIRPLWRDVFSLDDIASTKTYVKDIMSNYHEVEHIVDYVHKEDFSEWESMLVYTIYQALTAHAIKRWKKYKVKEIHFSDIPLTVFEGYFRKNLEPEDESEGNPEYLKMYKGFKNNDEVK